ncbi:FAD/NAD(P)-binding domain-containing protein [Mycena sanguinolenta]|uniref:FAD/NAD(P)-binding domain-containing protein n=1 Tax=Mycena sanguinolenta TaxID=230812 RepID=A0A8H6ZBQ1_9AGAR|nr:FAD/NAD(P)-binding domain-containing protein [Mycena sanguinolenta]
MAAHVSVPPPLRILIVGAGLCGLAAAASLRRQGHRVDVFESSLMNKEIDAAITVQGNAIRTGWFCHRTDLHDELKRLAIGQDETGPPASLHLGQEVVSCDPVAGTLTLKNGAVHQGDLIIGADGIHSTIRTSVLGYVQKALPSGMSTFRCLFDATKLEGLADMDWFSEGISGARVVLSPEERFQMLFLFPCRRGTLINVVAHHVDDRD